LSQSEIPISDASSEPDLSSRAVSIARRLSAATGRFLRGECAPDGYCEHLLELRFEQTPPALRAMRLAIRTLPVLAAFLLALAVSPWSIFHFGRNDEYALAATFLGGSALALVSYRLPRLTAAAFLTLWDLRPLAIAAYFVLLLVPPFVFDSVFLRRSFDGMLLVPCVAAAWAMYRSFSGTPWLARAFPLAFAVMAATPGFILPPYYQGIAGWTDDVRAGDTETVTGYRLVNDAGEWIWLTHTIFSPVTQVGRFPTAWAAKEAELGPLGAFIMKAYRRAYPLLMKGYMPPQRYLGHFAYPPHTFATNLPDHRNFPPDRIVRVQHAGLTYDRAGKLVDVKIYSDYEVPRP
jgi:hypothetical protein